MKISEIGVKRPVLTAMIFLGLVIMGLVSLSRLGLDLMPNLEIPSIAVVTQYQGAGPQEIESQVTLPLEKQLSTVSGLDKIESTSSQDVSVVTLKFEWGVDLEEKINEVRDKVGLADAALPAEASRPFVIKFDFSMIPVLIVGIEAKESYPRMYEYLDKKISRQLEQLPGVASVSITGGEVREVQVSVDRQRLEAYQIPVGALSQAIALANLNLPGGYFKSGQYEFVIRTPEEVTLKQLSKVVVAQHQGKPVFLSDIATVRDTFAEKEGEVKINRKPGLVMMVQKQSGVNTVLVSNRIMEKLPAIKSQLPPDVKLLPVFDQADFIRKSIGSLRDSLFLGGILVVLVIFFFIPNIRSSLIVVISIPVSLISTFILMYGAGFTLNLISLSSLGIAVGMVVDASVVIFENILRHREEGEGRFEAAIAGSNEVSAAVIASVLAVVTVFVPIIFTGGISGILFRQLALSFSFTLLCSLFTALTLIPLLCNKFLLLAQESRGWQQRLFRKGEIFFEQISGRYRALLNWTLNHKKRTMLGAIAFLIISFLFIPLVGTDFFPATDQGMITFDVVLPVGTRYEETGKLIARVEQTLAENVPETEFIFASWGRFSGGNMRMMSDRPDSSHRGTVMLKLQSKEKRRRTDREIMESVKPFLNFPQGRVIASSSDPMATLLFGGGKPLTVEVRGYDLNDSRKLSQKVVQVLSGLAGVSDIETSRDEGQPEYQVKIRREKAVLMGLSVSSIANQIKTAFGGDTSNKFRERGEQYDITLRLNPQDRNDNRVLAGLYIATPAGGIVRLSDVADISPGSGPVSIQRRNQERIVEVSGEIYGRPLNSVVAEGAAKFKGLVLPTGFSLSFAGSREEQAKSFRTMAFALVLSIILVYMVMASQFESYIDPLVIMFAVPFSIIGVVWALFLSGNTFSLVAFLGLIMLVGIIEETGIILLTFVITQREKGLALREAILTAGQLRLRPILMTSITTILGMVPLMFSRGESSEIFRPLAIVIGGGLLAALLTTLFIIPLIYYTFEEHVKPRLTNNLNGKTAV
ncbi:MAG: efflux RND transporter permease subunit [Candidatus Omnitrophota bacterium]